MSRHLPNWIESYIELMRNTEPAEIFERWTAYSVIAAALRRKVSLQLGRLVYYPNIYVVLVAEPGVARKTQAIKYGVNFLNTIPDIKTCADSSTKEAMTDDLESSAVDDIQIDGTPMRHCSLNIISKEFESFLGQKKENTRMLTALTDLFDCPDDWSSRTRHGTSNKIIRPWLNLLAATTPDSLASSLPATAIGGGLTSRIMFVWADKKKKSVAIPFMTDAEVKLKEKLEHDLFLISRISGDYAMTQDCLNKWTDWYDHYDEDESGQRICPEKAFSGWYSRKPTYILKIAMLRAAATTDKLVLEWRHCEEAIRDIQQVETLMSNAFNAVGKSELTAEIESVYQVVKSFKVISEKQLLSLTWKDVAGKFEEVIETLTRMGRVKRMFKGPNGETGIHYICCG